jgi:hypothetical protein
MYMSHIQWNLCVFVCVCVLMNSVQTEKQIQVEVMEQRYQKQKRQLETELSWVLICCLKPSLIVRITYFHGRQEYGTWLSLLDISLCFIGIFISMSLHFIDKEYQHFHLSPFLFPSSIENSIDTNMFYIWVCIWSYLFLCICLSFGSIFHVWEKTCSLYLSKPG